MSQECRERRRLRDKWKETKALTGGEDAGRKTIKMNEKKKKWEEKTVCQQRGGRCV